MDSYAPQDGLRKLVIVQAAKRGTCVGIELGVGGVALMDTKVWVLRQLRLSPFDTNRSHSYCFALRRATAFTGLPTSYKVIIRGFFIQKKGHCD